MNIWYSVKIYWDETRKWYTEFYDGLKKFPGQSLQDVAEMYGISGKTLSGGRKEEVFTMYRPEGYEPTDEEREYCLQDSRIQAYAIC